MLTCNDLRRWARALQGGGADVHETVPLEPSCPRQDVGDALMRYADCWETEAEALRADLDRHRVALDQRDQEISELRAENARLREIEKNVDKVTADWSLHCQELERLLAERVDDHTADLTRLTKERDEARAEVDQLKDEATELTEEVQHLRKCCTQRGARMQIMRDWMTEFPAYSHRYATMWDQFAAVKDALRWFDEDGVPK